jgi:hypothetical protein
VANKGQGASLPDVENDSVTLEECLTDIDGSEI